MTDRLNAVAAQAKKTTAAEWAERGNAYLRGEISGVKGGFIDKAKRDVRWVVRDGKCVIEHACSSIRGSIA